MEAVLSPNITSVSIPKAPTQVNASELLVTFHYYADKISVLSLDCFDTLLWRKTIEPKDVFFDLQQYPTFKANHICAVNRIDAEGTARYLMSSRYGHNEVTLQEIYQTGFPSLDASTIDQLIEEEIQAEIATCYAFPPVLELIKQAKEKGLKVVIVSNTYLKENQLRRLLQHTLPEAIYQSIDQVFCSCEFRQSKNNGLFNKLLSHYPYPPSSILHIGDNYQADFQAAQTHGINGVHLVQFNKKITDYLRLQSTAATISDASLHYTRSVANPFRGLFATTHAKCDKPESIVGYMSLGPIMYTFARYIHEEVEKLKQAGQRPKLLFLLRDAYLPYLACEAYEGKKPGSLVRISRLTAMTASFRNRKDIEVYLATKPELSSVVDTLKRLNIPDAIIEEITEKVKSSPQPSATLTVLMCQKELMEYIFKQSKSYFERLKNHIHNEANIKAGDTVVLVDLGYNGRTQLFISPVLEKEMNVKVTGRYLISLNVLEWRKSRAGLLDPSWCDDRSLHAITLGCSLLEELCTSADYSVIDYDKKGNPIFITGASNNETQCKKTKLLQAETIKFIHDAKKYFQSVNTDFPLTMLRDVALAELGRRTFFPLEEEVNFLQQFKHDFNFGMNIYGVTVDTLENELKSLRRMGLWFKNQTPYGVRSAGLPLSLTVMAQRRHGFATQLDDLSLIRENILVLKLQGQAVNKESVPALPTYDGYFSLWFSVNKSTPQIAIMFGLGYKLLQIESIYLIKEEHFYTENQYKYEQDIRHVAMFNQMLEKEENLFECPADTGSLIIPLESTLQGNENYILRVIFRPIIKRSAN